MTDKQRKSKSIKNSHDCYWELIYSSYSDSKVYDVLLCRRCGKTKEVLRIREWKIREEREWKIREEKDEIKRQMIRYQLTAPIF